MTQFSGPIEGLNQQFLRSQQSLISDITAGAPNVTRTVPMLPDQEQVRQQNEMMAMQALLTKQSMDDLARQVRQEMIDNQIIKNTQENPVQQSVLNQRSTPRLTIQQINNMSREQMRATIQERGGDIMGDDRSGVMKFLDLIDLPRNSIFNIAFTDEPDWAGAAGGFAEMVLGGAAIGAGIGAVAGAPVAGVGAIPGAISGAISGATKGAIAYAGTLGVASIIGHTALSEEDRREIRIASEEDARAAFGMRRVYFSEVLGRLGVENKTAKAVLGLAGDILLDPLSYATAGGSVAKWGARGAGRSGTVAVETRGVAFLKHASKEAMEKGRVVEKTLGDGSVVRQLVLPEGSQYKQFEDFLNQNIVVETGRVGGRSAAEAANIAPGLDRGKRLDEALDLVERGSATMTRKEKKQAVQKIMAAQRESLLNYRRMIGTAQKNDNIIDLVDMSRDFFLRFGAKGDYQTHIPFMDWVAPLLWRRTGYRNLGTNIPVLRGGTVGRQYKAVKQLDDVDSMMGVAEANARAAMLADIGKEIGRYNAVRAVSSKFAGAEPGEAVRAAEKFVSELPEDLAAKVSVVEDGELGARVEVNVTELNANQFDFVNNQNNFKIDAPEADAEWVFDGALLSETLHVKQRLEEIDGISDVARLVEEKILYDDATRIFGDTLATLEKSDSEARAALDLTEGAPPISAEQQQTLDVLATRITETKTELDALIARRDLVGRELEDLVTPRTSVVLDALDGIRGDFAGTAIGVHAGPGFLARLFDSHNQKVRDLQERVSRISRESRLTSKEFDKKIDIIRRSSERDVGAIAEMRAELNAINAARKDIIDDIPKVSDAAAAKAEEVGEVFGYNKSQREALGAVIDALANTWVARTGGKLGTKEEWIESQMRVVKGGNTPEGRQVLFQGGMEVPKKFEMFHSVHRSAENVKVPKGVSKSDWFADKQSKVWTASARSTAESVGVKNLGMRSGVTQGADGNLIQSNVISINEATSADDLMEMTLANAMLHGHDEVDIFTTSGSGKTAHAIVATGLDDASPAQLAEVFRGDVVTQLEDGTTLVIATNSKRAKKSIKELGGTSVQSKEGKIQRINTKAAQEAAAKGKSGEDAVAAAERARAAYYYSRLRYLRDYKGQHKFGAGGADPVGDYAARLGIDHDYDEWTEYASLTAVKALRFRGEMTAGEWINRLTKPGDDVSEFGWPYRYPRDMGDKKAGQVYGVSPDEMANSGLEDYLNAIRAEKGEKHKIGAGELEDFLRSQSMDVKVFPVSVNTSRITAVGEAQGKKLRAQIDLYRRENNMPYRRTNEEAIYDPEGARDIQTRLRFSGAEEAKRRMDKAALEVDPAGWVKAKRLWDMESSAKSIDESVTPNAQAAKHEDYVEDGHDGINNLLITVPESKNLTRTMMGEAHWKGVHGVLAHVRTSVRYIDGKKILQIDEMQSDPIQAAVGVEKRLAGYIAELFGVQIEKASDSIVTAVKQSNDVPDAYKDLLKTKGYLTDEFESILTRLFFSKAQPSGPRPVTMDGGIPRPDQQLMSLLSELRPPLPLSAQAEVGKGVAMWERTAARRAIKYALEQGYDGISVVPSRVTDQKLTEMADGPLSNAVREIQKTGAKRFLVKRKGSAWVEDESGKVVETLIKADDIKWAGDIDEFARDLTWYGNAKAGRWVRHAKDGKMEISSFHNPGLEGQSERIAEIFDDVAFDMTGRADGAMLFSREEGVKLQPGATPRAAGEGILGPNELVDVAKERAREYAEMEDLQFAEEVWDAAEEFYDAYKARINAGAPTTARELKAALDDTLEQFVNPVVELDMPPPQIRSSIRALQEVYDTALETVPKVADEVKTPYMSFATGGARAVAVRRAGRTGDRLWQTQDGVRRASVEFTEQGEAVIRALNSPDVGSFIHELGHVMRRNMAQADQDALQKRWGIFDEWDEATEEEFAQAFMGYLERGESPIPELNQAFESLGTAMKEVYGASYTKPINNNLRKALDNLFGATEETKALAKEHRRLTKEGQKVERRMNSANARQAEANEEIADLERKKAMAREAREEARVPLAEELRGLKESKTNSAAAVAEKFDRFFRDAMGVGRRGKYAGEAVSKFRYAHENLPEFQRKTLVAAFDKDVERIAERFGMTTEDAHLILLAKIVERDMKARGVKGFHPSDKILDAEYGGSVDNVMAKYGGRDRVWNDDQINRLADTFQKKHEKMAINEAAIGALATSDPRFAYVPLRMTEEAQRVAWQRQAALRQGADVAGRAGKISAREQATVHRATNRIFYRTADTQNAYYVDEAGDGWNYVWSGQAQETLPAEYHAYRVAYLRENPELMEAGDIFDYNRKIMEAGGSEADMLPTPGWSGPKMGNEAGPRWQPPAYATSPIELNHPDTAHKFADMMGAEYAGKIWETDLSLVLGKRMAEHGRMQAVGDFIKNLGPELKILTADEVTDAIRNPREGQTAINSGNEIIINGVPYRPLKTSIKEDKVTAALFGDNHKNYFMPEDVASAVEDYVTRLSNDETLTTIGRAFDFAQSIWKGTVLMNPAWTTVNIMGGVIHSIVVGRMGLSDFIEHLPTARKLSHQFHFGNRRGGVVPTGPGLIFDDANKYNHGDELLSESEMVEQLVRINAIDGSQAAREAINVHRSAHTNPNPEARKSLAGMVRSIATFGPLGAWWFKMNASIDDTFRTAVYLSRRAKGDTAEQAALMMKKAHFDYGDFTKLEESVGRRVIPFYAWQRNNIALQYKLLFQRPAYHNMWMKIKHAMEVEGLDEEGRVPQFMLPRWMKNQLMIQTSSADGSTKGLNIGNMAPIDDLLRTGQAVFGPEGFKEMVHYFIGSTSPILKSAFELGTGQQVFDGRKIGDPELGEKSITQYMVDQIGYYQSYKGLERGFSRDGLEGLLWKLAVRGRWQPLDIDRLQVGISIDTSEEIKLLRRSVNRAMKEGDEERAEAIAMRIINEYRRMWQAGIRSRVPKELWPQFRREEGQLRREGRPIPGANIPIQPAIQ